MSWQNRLMHKQDGTHRGNFVLLYERVSESDVLELANINARCTINQLKLCLFLAGWSIVHPTKRG